MGIALRRSSALIRSDIASRISACDDDPNFFATFVKIRLGLVEEPDGCRGHTEFLITMSAITVAQWWYMLAFWTGTLTAGLSIEEGGVSGISEEQNGACTNAGLDSLESSRVSSVCWSRQTVHSVYELWACGTRGRIFRLGPNKP